MLRCTDRCICFYAIMFKADFHVQAHRCIHIHIYYISGSCAAPGNVNNCPSRWTDLTSAIQVTWTAPERPNRMLLRYHLQLTTYGGSRVIASETVGSGTLLSQLDSSELREYQHKCGLCLYRIGTWLL